MGQINKIIPLGKSGGIIEYPNAVDQTVCDKLLLNLSFDFSKFFYQGPTISGVMPEMKRCMDTDFLSEDYTPESTPNYWEYVAANKVIQEALWTCVSDYIQEYRHLWGAPNIFNTDLRIQKYFQNFGYYREHCDGLPWDGISTPNIKYNRILAVIVYLNDVEFGGSTYFPDHNFRTLAEKGKIVIFPASWQYPHMGEVPHSSDKWIISTFICCAGGMETSSEDKFSKEDKDVNVINNKSNKKKDENNKID